VLVPVPPGWGRSTAGRSTLKWPHARRRSCTLSVMPGWSSWSALRRLAVIGGLAVVAAAAIEEAVTIRRELAAARPDAFRPDLAMSLNNLSADLGRREDALAAIEEAVTIRRELAARWPDAYHHELEQSLQVAAWLEGSEDFSDASPRERKTS